MTRDDETTVDVERAAQVLVSSALRLRPEERFALFMDKGSSHIGNAIARAAKTTGCRVHVIRLDRLGRDGDALPSEVVTRLVDVHASAFVASSRPRELGMRQHLLRLVREFSLRHAHMPGISDLAFNSGMRVDYEEVARVGERLLETLAGATRVLSTSPTGTRLRLTLSPARSWLAQLGVLEPGLWGNFPAGALFVTPETVEGTFVASASLGGSVGGREGLLVGTPVRFRIEGSRVRSVEAPHSETLQHEIEGILAAGPNCDRVGIVDVGVNVGIPHPTGNILVDQSLPGLHLGIGDPGLRITGADWSASTSLAACQAESTVIADGVTVIEQGRLLTPDE